MAKSMTFTFAVAQGTLAKAPIPSPRLSLVEKSAQIERVGESVPILAEIPTPQKGSTPAGASQTGSASPTTPLVNPASDPFVALS